MTTSKQKQIEARARKKAEKEALKRQPQPNTTTWVDEDYSKKLAHQLYDKIKNAPSSFHFSLRAVRRSPVYVNEEELVINGKKITRVYFLDYSLSRPGFLILSDTDYRENGKPVEMRVCGNQNFYLPPHLQQRLYERLRTNSMDDFKRAIGGFKMLPFASELDPGHEDVWETEDGRYHLVVEQLMGNLMGYLVPCQKIWVVKTFIAHKK